MNIKKTCLTCLHFCQFEQILQHKFFDEEDLLVKAQEDDWCWTLAMKSRLQIVTRQNKIATLGKNTLRKIKRLHIVFSVRVKHRLGSISPGEVRTVAVLPHLYQ